MLQVLSIKFKSQNEIHFRHNRTQQSTWIYDFTTTKIIKIIYFMNSITKIKIQNKIQLIAFI